jgi:hypothetical protein
LTSEVTEPDHSAGSGPAKGFAVNRSPSKEATSANNYRTVGRYTGRGAPSGTGATEATEVDHAGARGPSKSTPVKAAIGVGEAHYHRTVGGHPFCAAEPTIGHETAEANHPCGSSPPEGLGAGVVADQHRTVGGDSECLGISAAERGVLELNHPAASGPAKCGKSLHAADGGATTLTHNN